MDPNNPVSKLCAEGMKAEGKGNHARALELFLEAWEIASDAFEACIAAHYVARNRPDQEEMLRWNQVALRLARASGDDRVSNFFPSLLLDLGHSYEVTGKIEEAKRYYELAAERAKMLPVDQYTTLVRDGISKGLERIAGHFK